MELLTFPSIDESLSLVHSGPPKQMDDETRKIELRDCPQTITRIDTRHNRPFAQLLPGLETGHPVTVGQSPAYDFSVPTSRKLFFLSPFRTVLSAIHMQVTDRPSPDAPSLTQAIIVQMVYCKPCEQNAAHRSCNMMLQLAVMGRDKGRLCTVKALVHDGGYILQKKRERESRNKSENMKEGGKEQVEDRPFVK